MSMQSLFDKSKTGIRSLIASDRVESTPVYRSDGEKVGTIERLMIDKISGQVAYAVMSFGGFIGHWPGLLSAAVEHVEI